ncbi:MAG: hypothetical protein DRR19_29660 [Candidatus Parabeggiatoa sp. nov. 1]|nr:MAG: hypothetical protein DRR19_29660 [Gammaproteobacteria bacterium]
MSNITKAIFLLILFLSPSVFGGVPSSIPDSLPCIDKLSTDGLSDSINIPKDEIDKAIAYLMSIQVYPDSGNKQSQQCDPKKDKLRYYYLPIFRQVKGMAASLIINERRLRYSEKLEKAQEAMELADTGEMEGLKKLRRKLQKLYFSVKKKEKQQPIDAERKLYQELRTELQSKIDALKKQYGEAKTQLTISELEGHLRKIARYFGRVGVPISRTEILEPDKLSKKLTKVEMGNTGIFTLNAAAYFLEEEVKALKIYLRMRKHFKLPSVSLVKLPVETIEWIPVAELGKDADVEGVPIYRDLKGGGNFGGATINADLTMQGAGAFSITPSPVILPVYAKANVAVKHPRFEASIKCNFENWSKANFRSDVINGAIIYNDDLFQNFVSEKGATNVCKVTIKGGSGRKGSQSAILQKAAFDLKKQLQDSFFERVRLDEQELNRLKEAHLADVRAHRNASGPGFYWHTSSQKLESVSKFKYEDEIIFDGNESMEMDLNTQLCVAFNQKTKAYHACNIKEQAEAKPLRQSAEKLYEECDDDDLSREECRHNRKENAPVNPTTGNVDDSFDQDDLGDDLFGEDET